MDKIEFINTTDDKGITLKVTYDGRNYLVEVFKDNSYYQQKVNCSFTPTFGMDLLDQNECLQVAEQLALKVEQDLGI
jgi:hypothetical protein